MILPSNEYKRIIKKNKKPKQIGIITEINGTLDNLVFDVMFLSTEKGYFSAETFSITKVKLIELGFKGFLLR